MTDSIILPPNSKAIPVSKGVFAIVDDEDYHHLTQRKWHYCSGYAAKRMGRKVVMMHRIVLNTPKGMSTDHINGDKLDNRKCNLRICTSMQNNQNKKKQKEPIEGSYSSTYKGVCWHKPGKIWVAYISINKIRVHLGVYKNERDAALAYNKAAQDVFGEFANINVILED